MAGVLAQLVERLVRNEKVRSSSLLGSTSLRLPNRELTVVLPGALLNPMSWIRFLSLAAAGIALAGCVHSQPETAAPAAAPSTTIVTADNSLAGRVISYNSTGRFLVLNFPSRLMPNTDQRLFLYRSGLKVAEVKVTGPQNDDNIVADLVSGDVTIGDEVRDR